MEHTKGRERVQGYKGSKSQMVGCSYLVSWRWQRGEVVFKVAMETTCPFRCRPINRHHRRRLLLRMLIAVAVMVMFVVVVASCTDGRRRTRRRTRRLFRMFRWGSPRRGGYTTTIISTLSTLTTRKSTFWRRRSQSSPSSPSSPIDPIDSIHGTLIDWYVQRGIVHVFLQRRPLCDHFACLRVWRRGHKPVPAPRSPFPTHGEMRIAVLPLCLPFPRHVVYPDTRV